MKGAQERFKFRQIRVRKRISGTEICPRLSVYRGHKNIYAQIIDDQKGYTLVAASTISPELKEKLTVKDTIPAAKAVGELIAKKAIEKGIKKIVFDRRGYAYIGRIKALAEAAREAGLEF
jgi:large subunit ribosomal protein L18